MGGGASLFGPTTTKRDKGLRQSDHCQLLQNVPTADLPTVLQNVPSVDLPTKLQKLALHVETPDSLTCGKLAIPSPGVSSWGCHSRSSSKQSRHSSTASFGVDSSTDSFGEHAQLHSGCSRRSSSSSFASFGAGSMGGSSCASFGGGSMASFGFAPKLAASLEAKSRQPCRRRPEPLLVPRIIAAPGRLGISAPAKPWEVCHRRESQSFIFSQVEDVKESVVPQEQFKMHELGHHCHSQPRKQCSTSHLENTDSRQMLLIFDWDDTLCPTHFITTDYRLKWSETAPCFLDKTITLHPDSSCAGFMVDALLRHVDIVRSLLYAACSVGRVVIVTLAQRGWVETSMKNFLPGVAEVLEELGVEVIYARHSLRKYEIWNATWDQMDVHTLMKQAAISDCTKKVQSTSCMLENVMTIGDAPTEHDALKELNFLTSQTWWCKTLKLEDDPGLLQLTTELEALTNWIQPLFSHDGDLHVDLSNANDYTATCASALANAYGCSTK